MRRHAVRIGCLVALAGILLLTSSSGRRAQASSTAPQFAPAVKLVDAGGRTEPRVTIDNHGIRWIITNLDNGTAVVYRSADAGVSWTRVTGDPANQQAPTIDTDIVVTRTGRLIASELDSAGLTFRTSWSDDAGKSWTVSSGMVPVDTDRQWLAVGPDDATTHQPRVYLLFHNLLSGAGNHNMYVQTSTDNGSSFGLPIPTTLPGQAAFSDLQCADSGGPSSISVNPSTGQIYVMFGTRSGPALGGCTASAAGTFEINVVNATRVWVATSRDASLGSWTQSLAVDDNATGQVVGMQLSPGAIDRAGNVYVVYPESKSPDDFAASVKYVWAPSNLSRWSKPITVAPLTEAGHVLAHVVAGDAGRLGFAYFTGEARGTRPALWYSTYAQTLDGLTAAPHVDEMRLSTIPTYQGSARLLMGGCGGGVLAGAINGFGCDRSADVYGIALGSNGYPTVAWPTSKGSAPTDTASAQGGSGQSSGVQGVAEISSTSISASAPNADAGTFVASQIGGPSLFSTSSAVSPSPSPPVVSAASRQPAPAVAGAKRTHLPATGGVSRVFGAGLILLGAAIALRRPRMSHWRTSRA